jgi:hypothetical protein
MSPLSPLSPLGKVMVEKKFPVVPFHPW